MEDQNIADSFIEELNEITFEVGLRKLPSTIQKVKCRG